MEEPLQQALYGGNISGRRLRGVKINPIYQDSDRSATHKDDNDTQSESALPIGEIQIEMYESLPRNKQKIFKQSNSTPSLWSPNSSFDRDCARTSEISSPGLEADSRAGSQPLADEARDPSPLERKLSQKSQAKDHHSNVGNIPWTFLDNRSSPRHREPVWDAFRNVEKKIPPKLREESLEVVSNDSSDEVKSATTANNEKRTAAAKESLDQKRGLTDNESDISVLTDCIRPDPPRDDWLSPGQLHKRDDSFLRTRITASSYLGHLVHFVLEDSSEQPPSQGFHPNPTCCFEHFCTYCLPQLQQQNASSLPRASKKTDDAACKLFRNLLATEKGRTFLMKNGIKNPLNQSSGESGLERRHLSSDNLRMLLSLGTDVDSLKSSDVCNVHNSALQRRLDYVTATQNFSKQMIALSDDAHGRNGLTLRKAMSHVHSLLDSRTHDHELSRVPYSDGLITDRCSTEKKLKTTDDKIEENNEQKSEVMRTVFGKEDQRAKPNPNSFSDQVSSRRETTTECLHHSCLEDRQDCVSCPDTSQDEPSINQTTTCDLPVQKGHQGSRSDAVYFHDSPDESDDDTTVENSPDCNGNAKGPLVAAEPDDFLDNNNYLEGVDMCTSPWCERCRGPKTVRTAPNEEGRIGQEPENEQRKVAQTVVLTEVCQQTCIFHGRTLSRELADSSEQSNQKLSSLDDFSHVTRSSLLADEQKRNSAPSPAGYDCTTAPANTASVILRAEDLNAPAYLQTYLEEAQRQYLSLTTATKDKTDVSLVQAEVRATNVDPNEDILDENFIREQVAAVDAACEDALRRQKAASAKERGTKKRDRWRFFSFKDRNSSRTGSGSAAETKNSKVIRASIEDVEAEEDESRALPGSCQRGSGSDKVFSSSSGLSIVRVGGITTDDPSFEMIMADDSYEESPYTSRRRHRMQDSEMDRLKESPQGSLKSRIFKAAICTLLVLFVIGLIFGLAIHFGVSSVKNSTDVVAVGSSVNSFSGGAFVPDVVRRR